MYQGEFTHEGDRCTFETLLGRFGLTDPALHALGEIVHDVDCKDEKFGRAEAAGIAALIGGLVLAYPEDAERLERGGGRIRRDVRLYFGWGAPASRGLTLVGGCMSNRILGTARRGRAAA